MDLWPTSLSEIKPGTLVRWTSPKVSEIPYGTLGIVRSLSNIPLPYPGARVEWLDVDGWEYRESTFWNIRYMEVVEYA